MICSGGFLNLLAVYEKPSDTVQTYTFFIFLNEMVCTCEIFCRLTHVKKHLQPPPQKKRTYEVDQTAKISDFILKQKNQTCSLSVITSGTVNLKSISSAKS